jgi:glycosyltransferase involved in cell wall biosynthesis
MELISVIIPNYNRGELLRNSINSALNQTYSNIEVIISDDGSTDHSRDIVEGYRDPRVKWIEGTHSGLPSIPRNAALKKARGDWIAFLDSDDEWMHDKLEKQLLKLKQFPRDCLACCSNGIVYKGSDLNPFRMYFENSSDFQIDIKDLSLENKVITSSLIIHKSLLEITGLFPISKKFIVGEDYALWLKVATVTKIAFISEPLVKYRDNPRLSIRRYSKGEIHQKINIALSYIKWSYQNNFHFKYSLIILFNFLITTINTRIIGKILHLKKIYYKNKINYLINFNIHSAAINKFKNIKVSVLMPIFNAEKYLEESVRSILSQSHENFELIIINDGSTDDSLRIIKSIKDDRIILHSNATNVGISKSLNIGIQLSTGKYIARIDADDSCDKDRILIQLAYMEYYPDVGVLGSWIKLVSQDLRAGASMIHRYPVSHDDICANLLFSNPFAHPSVIIRSDILKKNEFEYKCEFNGFEDWELWFRLYKFTKFINIPKPLTNYRIYPYSTYSLKYPEREVLQLRFINNYIKQNGCNYKFLKSSKLVNKFSFFKDLIKFKKYFNPFFLSSEFVSSKNLGIRQLDNILIQKITQQQLGLFKSLGLYWRFRESKSVITSFAIFPFFYLLVVNDFQRKLSSK